VHSACLNERRRSLAGGVSKREGASSSAFEEGHKAGEKSDEPRHFCTELPLEEGRREGFIVVKRDAGEEYQNGQGVRCWCGEFISCPMQPKFASRPDVLHNAVAQHAPWSITRWGATRELRLEGYDTKSMSVYSSSSEQGIEAMMESEVCSTLKCEFFFQILVHC
jgi:hypothetical protein